MARIQIEDSNGHIGEITQMRDLRVASAYRLVGAGFSGTTLDTNFWTATTSGAGAAVTQADHDVTITSGTANNGIGHLASARFARFVFAHPNIARLAVSVPTLAVAKNTRRWGAFTHNAGTPTDGYYFELSAAGVISVCSCKAGTPTKVASSSWKGSKQGFTPDANIHAYEIHYFLMEVQFFVDGDLVYTIKPTTVPLIGDHNLNLGATSVNAADGTTAGILHLHAGMILRVGKESTQPRSQYQSGTVAALILKRGPGIVHTLNISGVANTSVVALWDGVTAASPSTLIYSTGAMGALTTPFTIDLHEVPFYNGLTLAITAANSTVTIVYE